MIIINEHDELLATVLNLTSRKTEGRYWDFKLQHHENNAALIHDILCLANAEHDGQRYLIFGVEDQSYELHSITGTPGRKSQANIAGLLRDNARKFFQSRTPDVYLSEVRCDGKSLDVLVIEDKPHKPYYLVEDYESSDKKVRAHHVYTRSNDTNTPMPEAAPPHEIERMWRERFGLNKTPLERAKRYLENPTEWVPVSEGGFFGQPYEYHRDFPEFTLRNAEAEEMIAHDEEWTRGEIRRDNNSAWYLEVYYHQTLLARAPVVTFDNRKKTMVAPNWEPRGGGRFYFYRKENIGYALQTFLSQSRRGKDHSANLRLRLCGDAQLQRRARALWPDFKVKIPLLSAREVERFLGPTKDRMQTQSRDADEQYQIFLSNQIDFDEWRKNALHS